MSLQAVVANPFMLLVNPEVVFAAIEKSERLNGLNRHLCRPLDRVMPGSPEAANAAATTDSVDADLLEADLSNDSADLVVDNASTASPFSAG
jgi:hypothetical protein